MLNTKKSSDCFLCRFGFVALLRITKGQTPTLLNTMSFRICNPKRLNIIICNV